MSIIPDPHEAQELRVLFADSIIINVAENALRAYGQDLHVDEAAKLLPMWRYTPELTDRERRAVLARFAPPVEATTGWFDEREDPATGEALPDGVDGHPIGPDDREAQVDEWLGWSAGGGQ